MSDWHNCYGDGWQNEIVPEAFSHPAKFARGLIRRIYEHALEQGYLKEGDTVLDPFAGVALGAADALVLGLNWVGNELESHFLDMGRGCECTGISKEDWVRCFGRWDRFRHRDGRHWCPRCVSEAGRVLEDWEPALPGLSSPAASYRRNSGKIPSTELHHYTGNIELLGRYARNGAQAVLLQGDSRQLCQVLNGARVQGIVGSPPFSPSGHQPASGYGRSCSRGGQGVRHEMQAIGVNCEAHSTNPANLGNMREGDVDAVISSPPFSNILNDKGQGETSSIDEDKYKHARGKQGAHRQTNIAQCYGDTPGQLGREKGDTFWTAARQIVAQCYQVLVPGGVAIWVVKSFVRNKQIVDFPGQWQQLCESCGFETIEQIRAWLVEDRGTQIALNGDHVTRTVERKSFFRRLAERKGSPRIDYEVVLVTRKEA